jgi:3-mercaptopyruvate sulfurtransferase SseA
MPLPSLSYFVDTMRNLNVKNYDDVILYSQIPQSVQDKYKVEGDDYSHQNMLNLLGIFRAQYLLEAFGHKGNIYILQDFEPEQWKEAGGKTVMREGYDYKCSDLLAYSKEVQQENEQFAYKIDLKKVTVYQEIRDIERMDEHNKKLLEEEEKLKKTMRGHYFAQNQQKHILPTVIDTRPWWMRKAMGETKVGQGLNYNDLLEEDPMGTGALVLKHPYELHEIFEEFEDIKIRGHYRSRSSKKSEKDKKEVIFTCQIGVSACLGYFALKRVLQAYQREISYDTFEYRSLPQEYQLSVYDGSYEDYKIKMQIEKDNLKKT